MTNGLMPQKNKNKKETDVSWGNLPRLLKLIVHNLQSGQQGFCQRICLVIMRIT